MHCKGFIFIKRRVECFIFKNEAVFPIGAFLGNFDIIFYHFLISNLAEN
jgi:hypothetical protein